ncbi:MAG: HNH endonuclease [Janthinobacterium lividum]
MDEQQAHDLEHADDLGIDAPQANVPETETLDTTERDTTEQNAGRRFFNRAERFVLQAAAGGRCEECGAALAGGFHADHRHPFIAGGPTNLSNAQALCPDCNRRKAARLSQDDARLLAERARLTPLVTRPPLPDWSLPLRPWQQRGAAVWQQLRTQQAQQERLQQERTQGSAPDNTTGTNMTGTNMNGVDMNGVNMTVTATPGSGKTNLALFLAAQEIRQGRADLLVVVAPTRAIKDQWATSAHLAGLALTAGWGNNSVGLLSDLHGCIITYAQIAALPDALRLLCARHRVFCVLDEVHHAAESRAWGEALFQALEHAVARLCLSGTAWRQDGNMIPFITYDEAGNSKSDVSYSYPDALRDGVVRDAFFFALNARTVWLDETGERTATFADVLGERDQSRRLRAALHADGGWLEAAILRADAALSAVRRGLPDTNGHPQPLQSGHPQPLQRGHPQAKGF